MFPFYRFYTCQLTDRLKYILHTPKELRSQGSDIVGGFVVGLLTFDRAICCRVAGHAELCIRHPAGSYIVKVLPWPNHTAVVCDKAPKGQYSGYRVVSTPSRSKPR
jgi:hypothetical protein